MFLRNHTHTEPILWFSNQSCGFWSCGGQLELWRTNSTQFLPIFRVAADQFHSSVVVVDQNSSLSGIKWFWCAGTHISGKTRALKENLTTSLKNSNVTFFVWILQNISGSLWCPWVRHQSLQKNHSPKRHEPFLIKIKQSLSVVKVRKCVTVPAQTHLSARHLKWLAFWLSSLQLENLFWLLQRLTAFALHEVPALSFKAGASSKSALPGIGWSWWSHATCRQSRVKSPSERAARSVAGGERRMTLNNFDKSHQYLEYKAIHLCSGQPNPPSQSTLGRVTDW